MTNAPKAELFFTTNVARNILSQASFFDTINAVLDEYTTNAYDACPPGETVEIDVEVNRKAGRIVVRDNACGMGREEFHHFLTMHGENQVRKAGRMARGRHGTGKIAALGIGQTLTVSSVRDGKRTTIKLSRDRLEAAAATDIVPVEVIEMEVPAKANQKNGTTITIEGIEPRKIELTDIRSKLERDMFMLRNAVVRLNGSSCKYLEPAHDPAHIWTFSTKGTTAEKRIGACTLHIRAASRSLQKDETGILVTSLDRSLAIIPTGHEGRPFANRIYGWVECDFLETQNQHGAPQDCSRRGLNPAHPVVFALTAFINAQVDSVLKTLAAEEKSKRDAAQDDQLRQMTDEIAAILNEHYVEAGLGLQSDRSLKGGTSFSSQRPSENPNHQAAITPTKQDKTERPAIDDTTAEIDPPVADEIENKPAEVAKAKPVNTAEPEMPARPATPKATGYNIVWRNYGPDADRATHILSTRSIEINRDHPQIAALCHASAGNQSELTRLAREVLTQQYAFAIVEERLERNLISTAGDAVQLISKITNEVARRLKDEPAALAA